MAIDLTNVDGSAYLQLLNHVEHEIVIATYGDTEKPDSVTIECETCHVVLIDFEKET